jgi:hypothetical protein
MPAVDPAVVAGSDVSHPGPAGHLAFYRELAPCFDLPAKLSWEF